MRIALFLLIIPLFFLAYCCTSTTATLAKIEDFKTYQPLIDAVCNPGLRDRHWIAMTDVIDVVGFELKRDDHTSLKKLLDKGVLDHLEKIAECSDVASREFNFEKALDKMIAAGETGSYDFAFIDADKPGYPDYFERCLTLMRIGGVIAVDNIFMGGGVADPEAESDNVVAMRNFNALIKEDSRVEISLIPIGDGLTLARKV